MQPVLPADLGDAGVPGGPGRRSGWAGRPPGPPGRVDHQVGRQHRTVHDPLGAVIDTAADVDTDAAALRTKAETERLAGARAFATHLASLDGLRTGLSVDDDADLIWTLNDGASYRRLVGLRGWPVAGYRDRLERVAAASLLGARGTP